MVNYITQDWAYRGQRFQAICGILSRFLADFDQISDADIDWIFINIAFCQATAVHKCCLSLKLLLEEAVCALPCFNSHATHFISECLPSEDSFFEYAFQLLVAFELLLSWIFLVFLHIVVQVDSDIVAVHSSPDVVESLVDEIFEEAFIKSRHMMQLNFCIAWNRNFASLLVNGWFANKLGVLVKDEHASDAFCCSSSATFAH